MTRKRIDEVSAELLLDYGVDTVRRTVELSGEVNPESARRCMRALTLLDRTPGQMILYINSEGGDVEDAGLPLYTHLRFLSNGVVGVVTGTAYSIAAWILQGCDYRMAYPNAALMIHDGSGEKTGFSRELDRRCREILLHRIRERHPRFSEKKLQGMLDTDTYLWPSEALELGLLDSIVTLDTEAVEVSGENENE